MTFIEDSAGIFLVSDPTKGVRFQLWPENLQDTKSVNWSAIDVIGRSEPIQTYHSSSPQGFSMKLMFVASMDEKDGGTPERVQEKVNFLKALTYPKKSRDGITTFPPAVWLIIGQAISSRCVVRSVSVSWEGPWTMGLTYASNPEIPLDIPIPMGGELEAMDTSNPSTIVSLPIVAAVNIELITIHETPLDFDTVVASGDRRVFAPGTTGLKVFDSN